MKILFASDMSFNYFPAFPGNDTATETMKETASVFASADFSVVNLENILGNKNDYTPIAKSGPNLNSDDDFVKYLEVLKPSAVGLANNHTGDYGDGAIRHTFEMLQSKNIKVFGAGENIKEAYMPAVFEKDGARVAVIAVCENEFGIAEDERPGAAGYSLGLVAKSIADAHNKGMLPVIYFHGGNEFNPFPSPGKTELYRHFIDLGAKAVIAMHTHCPQGYETYNGCPIIYSMGNFFFPKPSEMKVLPSWNCGYMTMLSITNEEVSFEIMPYRFSMDTHI
ncbi:MAG: CapA family protein, partial [Clostridia bacterium]|nr:CapA family protein [Clostridia bacterium]